MEGIFRRHEIIKVAKDIPLLTSKIYKIKDKEQLEFYGRRDRTLFSLLYLTGARIGEVVKRLRKKDFETIKLKSSQFLVVDIFTEKNRKHPTRRVPINIEREKDLVKYVLEYLELLKDEDVLFSFTIQRAWQIVSKILIKYKKVSKNKFLNANHFLRHCRLTHLVVNYDFSDQDLVKYCGWTNSLPSTTYAHLRYKDLARKML
jgi:site-specific recombinase XerD